MKEIEEMTLKMKQEKLDALKNTAVGKRAFADITNEVCCVLLWYGIFDVPVFSMRRI